MLRTLLVSLTVATLAATTSAQTCGNLAVVGNGAPGTSIDLNLTGSTPMALAAVAVGETLGSTTFNVGPLGSLTLDLDMPFLPLPLGFTDMNGDASLTINVPSGITMGLDLHAQAVAMGLSFGGGAPSLSFCVSNTAALHIGP